MRPEVNAIASRLSLRPPQRDSLEILDRVTALLRPGKDRDLDAALSALQAEFPQVSDFERAFPSLCFALATGVGKTRLMGAFIAYLRIAHGMRHFFVLAPNLTIYNKLISDFSPNSPKYVLRGIAEFATAPPLITTGENFERQIDDLFGQTTINIFNISKINSEVRGDRKPRIRSFREELGESYFDYLAQLPDLVLIMDESHRYRASAGLRAINELKPVLGLELTATPFVEARPKPIPFKNVIYDYPLARAMADGYVKEPAVVTRENFIAAEKTPEELQQIKLEDGVRLHESVKVELETYARQTGAKRVKPFVLVVASDTAHAKALKDLIESRDFFEGRYMGKVLQIDSSTKEDEQIARLLQVESTDEPTEIVVHVNMLKEGWDVTNLYTIVPLRAANARTLIEQTIGRGLRLPYGRRTGVSAVDRLNIVAHDRFQEILNEAQRPESAVRLNALVLSGEALERRTMTVESRPRYAAALRLPSSRVSELPGFAEPASPFSREDEPVLRALHQVICEMQAEPGLIPDAGFLCRDPAQQEIVRRVTAMTLPNEPSFAGVLAEPDISSIVSKATQCYRDQTISIPRILVRPKGTVNAGFRMFKPDLSTLRFDVPDEKLLVEHIRTSEREIIGLAPAGTSFDRLEDHIVTALEAFDDVAYDAHADLLYGLAAEVVDHLIGQHGEDDARKILQVHRQHIAMAIHDQMQSHYWEDGEAGYEHVVTRGFTELRPSDYTAFAASPPLDFRRSPPDKANMSAHLFGGFSRCLYTTQKFHSEPERILAVILDKEAEKWFRPAREQFDIYYRDGGEVRDYQPDFVAETDSEILMLEPKDATQLADPLVQAKKNAASEWCRQASAHAVSFGGKPWRYALIPDSAIAQNMTLSGLLGRYATT